MNRAALPLLLLLLLAPQAPAAEDLDRQVLESEAWRRGDYDGLFEEWLRILRDHPEAPQVEVCLRAWKNVEIFVPDPTRYLPRLKELDGALHGANSFYLRQNLVRLMEETGDYDGARKLRERDGDLRHWQVAGPFGTTGRACFEVAWPPERGTTTGWAAYPGEAPVAPFRYLRPLRGAAYAICQVRAEADTDATLWVQGDGSLRVWWNGGALPEVNRFRAWLPSTLCAPVRLSAGWNRVMVKCLSSEEGFRVRLLDAKGEPLGLAEEEGAEVHPCGGLSPPAPWSAWGGLAEYQRAEKAGSEGAWAASLRGFLLSEENVPDEALAADLKAARMEPKSAHIACLLGEVYHMALHLPAGERRNRSKDAYDKALALDPKFVPAMEDLAIYYRMDHQPEKALAILRRASEVNPKHFAGPSLASEILAEEKWGIEGRHALEELERRAPGNLQTPSGLAAELVALGNYPAAREAYAALAPRSAAARRAGVALARSTGDLATAIADAEAAVRRNPSEPAALAALGATLEDAGKLDEAIEVFRRAWALVPGEAAWPHRIGEVLIRAGRAEEGCRMLERALALDPSDAAARELLAEVRGESQDVPEAYRVDGDEAIRGAGPPSHAPVDYLLRQTVVRLRKDGSATVWSHTILRLNSQESIDTYQASPVAGTILVARTVRPDGTVLTPSQISDQGTITFPGLSEGAVVETCYRADLAPTGEGFTASFLFHDQARDGPVRRAQLVVECPKDLPLEVRERNFTPGIRIVRSQGRPPEGWRACVWEAERLPMLERQSKSPPDEELLPWVLVAEKGSWSAIVEGLREPLLGEARVTREIREIAAAAAKGCRDDREKAVAVYRFAQKRVQTVAEGKGAQETLSTREGSILVLVAALLDALGVRHEWVAVRPRAELTGDPVWDVPRAEVFAPGQAANLLRVPLADGALWLAGEARLLAPGQLPEILQGGTGLVLDPEQARFVTVPTSPPESLGKRMTMDATLSADGMLSGKSRFEVHGTAAAAFKDRMLGMEAPQQKMVFQTLLAGFFLGFQLQEMKLPDLDTAGTPLAAEVTFKIPSYAQVREGHMQVPGPYPLSHFRKSYCHERERTVPMRLATWEVSRCETVIQLPEGWHATRLPEDCVIQGDIGRLSITWRAEGDRVRVRHELEIPPQVLPPAKYADLVKFCAQGDEAEEQRMELGR